jgi:hypothetical protein
MQNVELTGLTEDLYPTTFQTNLGNLILDQSDWRHGSYAIAPGVDEGRSEVHGHAGGKQFIERNTGVLNRTPYPSDVIANGLLWRLRCKPALRDLPEVLLRRSVASS